MCTLTGNVSLAAYVQMKTAADADAEYNILHMFEEIAGDDLEVDPYELQYILNSVFMKGSLSLMGV